MRYSNFGRLVAVGCALASIAISFSAFADPGDGLKSTDGAWKESLELTVSGTYDDNVFRTEDGEGPDSPKVGAPSVTFGAGVSVSNPDADLFLLDLSAGLQEERYFGASRGIDLTEQSGLSAQGDVSGTLNPTGDVRLKLVENFTRTNHPSNFAGSGTYNWIVNQAGATVGIHPGADILNLDLGYRWWLYSYSDGSLENLDRDEHRFDVTGRWKFLPKTSLLIAGDYGLIRWDDQSDPGVRPDLPNQPVVYNYDANPLRLQGGLAGLLTRRIALRGTVGYGWSMNEKGPDYRGVIGTAALSYTFGRLDLENTFKLGYQHGFRTATLGNYYSHHTMFANVEASFWEQLLTLYGGGRFEIRDYSQNLDGTQSADDTGDSLDDELLGANVGIRSEITDFWSADLRYDFRANFTDDHYNIPSQGPNPEDLEYVRKYNQNQVTLSTTLRY